jgi:hypothetical protein
MTRKPMTKACEQAYRRLEQQRQDGLITAEEFIARASKIPGSTWYEAARLLALMRSRRLK